MLDEPRHKALGLHAQVKLIHHETFICIQRLKEAIRQEQDLAQVVDIIAVLKKSDELLKDLRTEISSIVGKLSELTCKMYINSNNIGEPIRTAWITATPDVKIKPCIPTLKSDPEKYVEMCQALGYPAPSSEVEMFRPHYPGVQEYLSNLQAEGEQLPDWVNAKRSGSEYTVKCLWKRDVDLDSLLGE